MSLFQKMPGLVIAEFESTGSLLHAAEKIVEAGYKNFDCHSPFPIHGMDQAMKLKRSPMGYIIATMGALGMIGIVSLTYWSNVHGYQMVISGKPYFSWQAFVPVIFAITILLSAFGAFFGMLILNKLPQLFNPIFNSDQFAKVTNDGFFVIIQADDPIYDEAKLQSFLASIGGKNVEVIAGE